MLYKIVETFDTEYRTKSVAASSTTGVALGDEHYRVLLHDRAIKLFITNILIKRKIQKKFCSKFLAQLESTSTLLPSEVSDIKGAALELREVCIRAQQHRGKSFIEF